VGRRLTKAALAAAGAAVLFAAAPAVARAATPWCGTDAQSVDRTPEAVAGQQIHVIYAIPSDGADRFASLTSAITSDVAAIDAWWRREDPARAPRFDLFAFPGCAPGVGQLDLSFVRLAQPAATYQPLTGRLARLSADLVTAGFGHRFKKYLVFYDGVVESGNVCGQGFLAGEQGGAAGYTAVWVQSLPGIPGCGTLGLGDYLAATAVHELLHGLGAVPTGAPHGCPGDPGHICGDNRDIMGPSGEFDLLTEYSLDPGRDDYYGHSSSWLDVQDSAWLQRLDAPDFPLTVTPVGALSGETISSDLPGIACPPACSGTFESGARVQLTPGVPPRGRRFLGWRGSCTGATVCAVTLDQERRVDAVWGPASFRISVRVAGRGRVTTTNFGCTTSCAKTFAAGKTFVFRARPAKGWRFVRWSGACKGRTTCRVATTAARSFVATFRRVAT
jgi:hypothetical protein